MSTSATRSSTARGFTLVEVLVVVVLIAITVLIVTVRIAPDDRDALKDEASRLAALLSQARDEAILTGSSLAWRVEGDGYVFLQRARDRTWAPFDGEGAFRQRALMPPVQLLGFEIAGRAAEAGELLVFPSSGMALPFRIVLGANALRMSVRSDTGAQVLLQHE